MLNYIRTYVSENRRRYIGHDINLDLSYVSDKIIAMAFPSEGYESVYMNSLHEVKDFLEKQHGGCYKIFNLCSEKEYDVKMFDAPVVSYPFNDHQPPPFPYLLRFCKEAKQWLAKSSSNVIVVHCKAGKGRTGTMVASLLLYLKEASDAEKAIYVYGAKRTSDGKGITNPSQIRYVQYFDFTLKNGEPQAKNMRITKIVIHSIPTSYMHGRYIAFKIYNDNVEIYDERRKGCTVERTLTDIIVNTRGMGYVHGDVRIVFQATSFFQLEHELFYLCFNTGFHSQSISLRKDQIDKAFKDDACKEFSDNFKIDVYLEDSDKV